MNWWQSLLIALVPAIITALFSAVVAIAVAKNNIDHAKQELQNKYQLERNSYIKKIRFDTEFEIYKEISEKLISLAIFIQKLFPQGIHYEPVDPNERIENYLKLNTQASEYITAANMAINSHAAFIKEEWYNRSLEIKALCVKQANLFYFLKLNSPQRFSGIGDKEEQDCYQRTNEITDKVDILIKDLRIYIQNMETQGDNQ